MSSRRLKALNKFLYGKEITYLAKKTDPFEIAMTSRWRLDRPAVVIYPRVETRFQPDSSIETVETQSVTSSNPGDLQPSEEYRITGLIWATPGLTNTCNVDSFLSFWVRRVLQTHGRAANNIVTTDLIGNALIKIADEAQLAQGTLDAQQIKMIWYKAVLESSGETHVLAAQATNLAVDCMGINTCSVFQHLKNHTSYATETVCKCGTVYNRDFYLQIPSVEEIKYLTNPDDYSKARTPTCLGCGHKRVLVDLVSDPNNWILPISWTGTGINRNPSLRTIPKFITFGRISYKIGYVSYSQLVPGMREMSHEISIQNIRGLWYLYDGILDNKFHKFEQDFYTKNNARMSSLLYIKTDETDHQQF